MIYKKLSQGNSIICINILHRPMWLLVIVILAVFGIALVYPNIGLGGGFLHVPVLMYLAGLGKNSAVPISLTLVLAGALAALPGHYKSGNVDPKLAAYLSAGAAFGAVGGARLNLAISQNLFEWLFAITIIIICAKMLYDLVGDDAAEAADDTGMRTSRICAAIGLAFLAGLLASTFGIGGGLVFVPTMMYILRRRTKLAAGTSTLVIVPTSIVGLLTYFISGANSFDPDMPYYILALVPVALLGAYVGSRFCASRLTGNHIKILFISLSLMVAVTMIAMAAL
jgi:uncharacterized membrane protein YfcA